MRDLLAIFSRGDVDGVLAATSDDATWWVSRRLDGMSGIYDQERFGPLLQGAADSLELAAMEVAPRIKLSDVAGSRV